MQIYFDFSGYSDMAIGLGLMFGVRLPINFNSPYKADNIVDFWRRWHMTLSRWLRDYVYIPLGANRGGERAELRNLVATMAIGGLWHGANWTFVIWGFYHGFGLAAERWWKERPPSPRRRLIDLRRPVDDPGEGPSPAPGGPAREGPAPGQAVRTEETTAVLARPVTRVEPNRWLARLRVFTFVTVGWVFFRAADLPTALSYLMGLLTNWGVGTLVTPTVLLAIAVGMVGQFVPRRVGDAIEYRGSALPPAVIGLGVGLWLVVINLLGPQGVAPFIYFQF
jgi:D-alanyl-lipoteichoic acid acyltransferase DltB (MBOAT superfamily)